MTKAFINNQEIPSQVLYYDEWGFHKNNPDSGIFNFKLVIDYGDFERELKLKYNDFKQEMLDDDINSGQSNFFLETYGVSDYPSFEEIITGATKNFKIEFLNDFFIKEILLKFTSKEKQLKDRDEWIIRDVLSVDNDKMNVYIDGIVQPIIHM